MVSHQPGRQRSPRKAELILEGARQEFLQRGYAAASMDRIAAAAGVSKPTVYSHYGDKASLFRALTTWMVERRVRDVFGGAGHEASAALDPAAQLRQLASRIVDVSNRQPEMLDFLRLVIGESGRFPDLAQGFVAEVHQQALSRLAVVFSGLTDQPELKARIFIGSLMHAILFDEVLHGDALTNTSKEHLVRHLVDLLLPSTGKSPH